ncbi:TBPIP domain containing protein [Gracilaria domingensis]|nr:TBPIP domain containing protein [Gracilaria domingensis]
MAGLWRGEKARAVRKETACSRQVPGPLRFARHVATEWFAIPVLCPPPTHLYPRLGHPQSDFTDMAKGKKNSEDEEVVHKFLQAQNRPFSVQNIVDSLQKSGLKKTAVERSLASLVEKKLVTKKEYGKAKIFIAAQDIIEIPNPDEVKRLDDQIADLQQQLSSISEQVDQLASKASGLRAELTLDEAKTQVEELIEETGRKEQKLGSLGDGSSLMSKEDKTKLELSYYQARSMWKKYRRIVTDITDAIGEASGKKRAQLFEELAIESDEAANIKLSDFPEMKNPTKRKGIAVARSTKKAKK